MFCSLQHIMTIDPCTIKSLVYQKTGQSFKFSGYTVQYDTKTKNTRSHTPLHFQVSIGWQASIHTRKANIYNNITIDAGDSQDKDSLNFAIKKHPSKYITKRQI